MTSAGEYEDYASVAELYDYVTPYRSRPDVAFFVEAAPYGSKYPGELLFVARRV